MRKTLLCLIMAAISVAQSARAQQAGSCNLVDQGEYKELTAAVESLGQALGSIPGCKGSPDAQAMFQEQERLRQSALQLRSFWENPSHASGDVSSFSNQLTSAIGSVNTIADSLANSSLADSACGQAIHSKGKVLLAVSDVVTGLAPLAVLAGTMTATLSVALPYVLGVAGVASVFKVLGTMHKEGTFDMNTPEHRQLVLRSTCEYSKIHQRLRYLMLMQSGNITGLKAELDKRMRVLDQSLAKQPKLKQLVDQYKVKVAEVETISRTLSRLRSDLDQNNREFMRFDGDKDMQCSIGRVIAKKHDSAPFRIAKAVAEISSKYPVPEPRVLEAVQLTQSKLEKRAREEVAPENSAIKSEDCAVVISGWFGKSAMLLQSAEASVRARQVQLQAALRREPEYNRWSKRVSTIEADRVLLAKVVDFMKVRSSPGSAIARAELIQREQQIRATLFGVNTPWKKFVSYIPYFGSRNRSLVGNWLAHSNDLYRGALASFSREFSALDQDVFKPIVSDWSRIESWKFQKYYDELRLLTLKDFPRGTRPWANACRRLDDLHISWLRAQDHFESTRFFCSAIKDIISNDVEPIIIKTCVGDLSLDAKSRAIKQQTAVEGPLAQLRRKHAMIVQAKRIELQCQMSTPNE